MQGAAPFNETEALNSRIAELISILAARDKELADLRHQIDRLTRMLCGHRSEKLDPNQLKLFFAEMEEFARVKFTAPFVNEAPDVEAANSNALETKEQQEETRAKKGHGRRRLPENLPTEETHIHPPEVDRTCAETGEPMREIGVEVTEQLDYRPASFVRRLIIRHKYACTEVCLCGVTTPALPEAPIYKGLPGPGLLAHVLVSKYADHLPLHRLSAISARSGVHLSKSTMCGWIDAVAALLDPIIHKLKVVILASRLVQADGTGIRILDKSVPGGSRKGAIWVYASPERDVVFEFSTKSRDGPAQFLKDFEGHLQADADLALDHLYKSGLIVETGCWAHGRRRFFEALDSDPEEASRVMAIIRLLYKVESDAKAQHLRPDEVLAVRQSKSVPLLELLKKVLDEQASRLPPSSSVGKAVGYALRNWDALKRYTEDGRLDIDNNASERRLRSVAVGRKNWLFAGSDEGAQRGAALYSLIATCKENGIEPFEYLRDVIARMPTHPKDRVAELTPKAWKAARLAAHAAQPSPAVEAVVSVTD